MKRVLLVAAKAGYQTRAFVEAAHRIGAAITLATDRCPLLDDPWRDGAVPVHEYTGDADAVIAIGDQPAAWAAQMAASRGLRFHSPAAVAAACNKFAAREHFAAAGLLTPWYRLAELNTLPPAFPCVLKPARLSASRGVIRVNDAAEYRAAFRRIEKLLKHLGNCGGPIVVEEFIPGAEFAVEGVMRHGQLHVLATFDKPDPLDGPYFEESIYVTPSCISLHAAAARAVAALGLTDGPVHAEFRVDPRGVWPLEVAPRPIGGLCARVLRFGPDAMPLEELLLRHALGDDSVTALALTTPAAGVMMIPIPGAGGIYRDVEGVDTARAVPLIDGAEITAVPGQHFEPLPEGGSYLGFLFASGDHPAAVEAALRAAHARLRFHFATPLPAAPPSRS
ncbi:MAG: ATP-grasp domain-containing protein [Bryobacterales bacterium]|nr:ATP-grasp domain-containing protein [Bryobacterales bacterium]